MSYLENSQEYRLKKSLNLWVVIAVLLMVCNLLLVLLCWYALVHQKIEITPFFSQQGYIKSDTAVDVHYLDQMSENFILTRLNVTPSNIKANHARLLNYVSSKTYHDFSSLLLREQQQILRQKISSYFEISAIVSNPRQLKTKIDGQMHRFVGARQLPSKRLTYELQYEYHLGRLAIVSFKKIEEHQDA